MLTRWDPFAEMNRLQEQLFGRRVEGDGGAVAFRPAVDIREEDDAFVVHAELPGIKPEDVDIEVEHGVLTIKGERRFTKDEREQKTFRRVERYYGSFSRSFSLPDNVDADQVAAKLEQGVLEVRVPKRAQPQPKKIQVHSA